MKNRPRQWRVGWIRLDQGSEYPIDQLRQELGLTQVISECIFEIGHRSEMENPLILARLLRKVRELSEEVDVLILGIGLEQPVELIRESVRIPVICAAKAPLIVAQIYGTKIGIVDKGLEDLSAMDRASFEAIALLKPNTLEQEIKHLEEQLGVPVIDSARAALLLADLAAKNHFSMRLRHHDKGGRLFC